MSDYIKMESLPLPLTRWWLKTRPVKDAIQLGPEGMPACIEFYVPFWAWPMELLHRLFFGKTIIKGD